MLFITSSVKAATVEMMPRTNSVHKGDEIVLEIKVDTGDNAINGVDANIFYDPKFVKVKSVLKADFMPFVSNRGDGSRLEISTVVLDNKTIKKGKGTIAVATFEALNSGNAEFKFDCDLKKSDTSKIVKNDLNATNLIECEKLSGVTVSIDTVQASSSNFASNTTSSPSFFQSFMGWLSSLFGKN